MPRRKITALSIAYVAVLTLLGGVGGLAMHVLLGSDASTMSDVLLGAAFGGTIGLAGVFYVVMHEDSTGSIVE